MGYMISKSQIEEAANWAGTHVKFDALEVLREMPWGVTARLTGSDEDHYLKILPRQLSSVVPKTTAINKLAPAHTAEIIASEPSKNWLLFADHKGERLSSYEYHQQCRDLLYNYAKLQGKAAGQKKLISPVPKLTWKAIWGRTMDFVSISKTSSDPTASLSDFIGHRETDLLANSLLICSDTIAGFVKPSFKLPQTINHGDLHTNNVAIQPNGEIVFHDWDGATSGPAGLSLNGVCQSIANLVLSRLMGGSVCEADDLVGHYVQSLCDHEYADRAALEAGIPGAAFCGLLNSLTAYADFPPLDDAELSVCCPDINRICNDIIQCCILFAAQNKQSAVQYADLLNSHQRMQDLFDLTDLVLEVHGEIDFLSDRDFQLENTGRYSGNAIASLAALSRSIVAADDENTVPEIFCQRSDRVDLDIGDMKASAASKMFFEHGCLILNSAYSTDVVTRCREQYDQQGGNGSGDALNVGHQRYMQPLQLSGAFNTPEIYACPGLTPVLARLLGPDFVLGSATLVVSSPGAEDQHKHIDHPHLFSDEIGAHLPPHAITVLVPLVNIDETIGGTAVAKGSHRVSMETGKSMPTQSQNLQLGSCLLFDYRLYHHGLANRSNKDRPVISLVYQRPWFRDAKNFETQRPLQMSANEYGKVPRHLRHILSHLALQ